MGKLRRGRKNQHARVNPLGGKPKSGTNKQDMKDEQTRQSKILPLINKLKSTLPNEKSMGLGAITILSEDARMRKLLLKEKVIITVMENCLNDANDEVVVEAFGLLRNLGIEEGYEVTKFYWRSNIWTSIENALEKIQTSFKYLSEKEQLPTNDDNKKKKEDKTKLQLLYDFTENVLSLIVVLASGSEDMFDKIFNKIDPILKLVVDILNWNIPVLKTSTKLFNALLDFLFEFSSESIEFIQKLSEVDTFNIENLLKSSVFFDESNNNLAKIYIEGLKFHYYEGLNKIEDKNDICNSILNSIFSIITRIDLQEIKLQLFNDDNANNPIQKQAPQPESNLGDDHDERKDINEQISGDSPEKTKAKADLQALEVSIDLTTSIWEYLSINEINIQEPIELSDSLTNTILKVAFPSFIELVKLDQSNQGVFQLTNKVLITLNNVCWLFLSSSQLPVEWYEHSINLWQLAIELLNKDNLYYQKNCLTILWAITKTIGEQATERIDDNLIQGLIKKSNELVQSLEKSQELEQEQNENDFITKYEFILSSVGFLGSLASIINNIQMTGIISQFLINSTQYFIQENYNHGISKAIEIPIESLNLIFDIFGDAYDYDYEIFVKGNYAEILSNLENPVKDFYKKIDKNKNPELKIKGEEVWNNLGRFVQYKISERN